MAHREPGRIPGRAYRMSRQRLRMSTASLIGCRARALHLRSRPRSLSKVASATSAAMAHTGARLSDAAPATSDKHRLLIGCRAGGSHLKSRRRSLSIVASATSAAMAHTGARLSDVAPATSDKHRLLIGCRAGAMFAPHKITDVARSLSIVASATSAAMAHTGARLSDAAPAASDKHRLLIGCRAGVRVRTSAITDAAILLIDVARGVRSRASATSAAMAHTGARLSDAAPAASDKHRLLIGCRAGGSHLKSRRRSSSIVASATSAAMAHTGARLSDAAPAASDKHRLLIGCRAGGSHLKSRRRSSSIVASATSDKGAYVK